VAKITRTKTDIVVFQEGFGHPLTSKGAKAELQGDDAMNHALAGHYEPVGLGPRTAGKYEQVSIFHRSASP